MNENLPPKTPNNNVDEPTIKSWLEGAVNHLNEAGIASARLDAELLLAHTLRKPRTWLHSHNDDTLDPRQAEIADARLDLRLDRVPVAYIIGHKEFYGRTFKVTTATLIPRPESEDLIDLLNQIIPEEENLKQFSNEAGLRLVDVGTGSGVLGITAKLEHPSLDVTLADLHRHAVTVAEDNAQKLNAAVTTLISDLLTDYPFTADIIIANLPYVDPRWERSPETDHEPASALFAEEHGLATIFKLLAQTKDKLANDGFIILEADPVQHSNIIKEAARYGLIIRSKQGYGLLLEKLALKSIQKY